MTNQRVLICSIIFFCLSLFSINSYAQCSYQFKISSKTVQGKGIIEVDMKGKSAFSVELYNYTGLEKALIQSKEGSGDEKISFKGLSTSGVIYRIAVVVPSENNFLCKKKMSDDIFFTIN
jgi:hypothetical protein